MMRLLRLLLPVLVVFSLYAQDGAPQGGRGGASQFPAPKEDDTLFVVDDGPDLDTACTFRRGGPLVIHLPIRRFVGETNPNGTLKDPGVLANLGVISRTAHLRMPVYDVDSDGNPNDPSVSPEVDRVMFNGKYAGDLSGVTDEWKENEFTIQMEWIKFPVRGGPPADNVIEIYIDQANSVEEQWCTAVDWAKLEFQAVAPVFLVHGLFAQSGTWVPAFTQFLTDQRIPHSADINLNPVGSIRWNGYLLGLRLQALADEFGAKKCHIVAHSKGGLDTRAYLNSLYDPERLKVLTVHTLSTPHLGTPVADVGAILAVVLGRGTSVLKLVQALAPALLDLTTFKVALFNLFNPGVPPGTAFYSYGADADLNHNRFISVDEAQELPPNATVASVWGTITYNFIGHGERAIVISLPPDEWGENTFSGIDLELTPFVPNDTLVSNRSAEFGCYIRTIAANHSTIKSKGMALEILEHIKGSQLGCSRPLAEVGPNPGPTSTSLIRDFFQLTPARRTETYNVTVDATQSATFFIVAASRTLNVTVKAPGGATYPVEVAPLANDGAVGAAYAVTVTNPVPGPWSITVTEPGQLVQLNVVSAVFLSNAVQSVLAGGEGDPVPLGAKVRLALSVFDGTQRLRGLTIAAQLLNPANASAAPVPVSFRDDGTDADTVAGDGMYQAFVTPPAVGDWGVRVEALGTASTGAFRRSSAAELRVVARAADITDVDDDGEDDDFNGLDDRIVVTPYADLDTAGTYEVLVGLRASNGKEVRRSVRATFPAGGVHADIPFGAEEITAGLGVDGPYAITEVRFSRVTADDLVPVDVRYNLGMTDDYDLDDLEHPRIRLTGTGSARGLNLAGDARYEVLEVQVEVFVERSGRYSCSVALYDRNGREISFITGDVELAAGTNSLLMHFAGENIVRNGVHGPWYVRNLAMYGAGESLLVNDVFTTPAFRATEFGEPARRRTARH